MLSNESVEVAMFRDWMVDSQRLSDSTIENYAINIKPFLVRKIDLMKFNDVMSYMIEFSEKKRNYSVCYAIKMYAKFKLKTENYKAFINFFKESKFVPQLRLRKNIIKVIDENTRLNIIDNINEEKHKIIARVQMVCGVRAGDIMLLKRSGITKDKYCRKDGKMIDVLRLKLTTKGNKSKVITIFYDWQIKEILDYSQRLVSFLKVDSRTELIDENKLKPEFIAAMDEYIFLDYVKHSKKIKNVVWYTYRMNYQYYRNDIKQALVKVGIDPKTFSTHSFRYLFARKVYDVDKDIEKLQKALGHSRLESTIRYLRASGQDVDDIYAQTQGIE